MTPTLTTYGQLQAIELTTVSGARAVISLYGAHLLSWRTADGRERLFCSSQSSLDGSRAIRGGVPVIFPQFGTQGSGQRHGFARTSTWLLEECGTLADGGSFAELVLTPAALGDELAQQWPCRLRYRINLGAQKLDLQLQVDHLGQQPFNFAAALHTYFALDDIEQCRLQGLQGVAFTENAASPPAAGRDEAALECHAKIDRMYRHVPRPLRLEEGTYIVNWQQSGFVDAVVWNPWRDDAAALADMADDEYRRFICVEAALLTPQTLLPGQSWTGRHSLLAAA